jgi:signal transduction histidine kinase
MLFIRVVDGINAGEEIKTRQTSVTVGRSPECRLVLKDRRASRVHGELFFAGRQAVYRDLLSQNGSTIEKANGQQIELTPLLAEWYVEAGDRLLIGDSVLEIVSTDTMLVDLPCPDELTMTVSSDKDPVVPTAQHDLPTGTATALSQFLSIPSYDPSDLEHSKRALGNAMLDIFPQAACLAIVDIRQPKGDKLTRDDVQQESAVICPRGELPLGVGYSFAVLAEAYQRQAVVCFTSKKSLPDSQSVHAGAIKSCMCAPVFGGANIIGFVHLHSIIAEARAFSSRDVHLFALLTSIASLLLRQARAAQEKTMMRTMASVGQVLAGLSHDAKSVLASLGNHAELLERSVPELQANRSWKYVCEDLKFLRFLIRDTLSRLRPTDTLILKDTALVGVVDHVLELCQHFFLEEADKKRVRLLNRCRDNDYAYIDSNALSVAIMNSVKNAVDAYLMGEATDDQPFEVYITSGSDLTDDFCLLSVCDQAGGIAQTIIDNLGQSLVSTKGTKGTGLGFTIMIETLHRLGGHLRIASSTQPTETFPAGTVVSMALPKRSAIPSMSKEKSRVVVEDYEGYRKHVFSQ